MNDIHDAAKSFWNRRLSRDRYQWTTQDFKDRTFEIVSKYVERGSTVLDLGAGDCEIANRIMHELDCKVTAVDFVPRQFEGEFIVEDLRSFRPKKVYDVVLMLGVAQYLSDDALSRLYASLRGNFWKLVVKHQCHRFETKKIDVFSEELQDRYVSIYRTVADDTEIIRSFAGVDVVVEDLDEFNRHSDTYFKLFYGEQDGPSNHVGRLDKMDFGSTRANEPVLPQG
jgi:cyclopropane fatty-acyl-phospholipid synthase-like methyltransferase